jgi:hypothetical protein
MNITRTITEDPKADQWRLLSQYSYPTNIRRYLDAHGRAESDKSVEEYVAGCVRQGDAYFAAAEKAPLDIAPLLLYYGSSNLLAGSSAMMTGEVPVINNHGMRLKVPAVESPRIADVNVLPFDPHHGALQHFSDVFSGGCPVASQGLWTVEEILGSVPDLKQDFENCYQSALPFTIPVELRLRTFKYDDEDKTERRVIYERVCPDDVKRFQDPVGVIRSVERFSETYLFPHAGDDLTHIVLYRKWKAQEIGFYSVYGRKYLEVPHVKGGRSLSPAQLIIMYMGLFALGYVSRYHPELWTPFVRSDTTGERLVVEKFLNLCQRYVPNLVLNAVSDTRVEFVQPTGTSVSRDDVADQ